MDITNQCAAVKEPENKNSKMPLRYQLEMELLGSQNARLIDQRNKLLDMVERLQSVEEPKPMNKIEMIQTPAGYVKVGDVIGYDRSNKRIRFGTVSKLNKDGVIWLTHSYCVVFGDDGKQEIYQSMDGSIEHYRVCKVL
jgi:hypothetical protein|nr:MAG TPA: hypothetical protein [Caudoviricetes sp.]